MRFYFSMQYKRYCRLLWFMNKLEHVNMIKEQKIKSQMRACLRGVH